MAAGIRKVREYRIAQKDSFYFNWSLDIPLPFQQPFVPTHPPWPRWTCTMAASHRTIAADLRRAFSGIVAGNVKEEGIREIEQQARSRSRRRGHDGSPGWSPARIRAQRRMKIAGDYRPCYEIVA